jgi:tetratricopeptide (TPR) repeat protein
MTQQQGKPDPRSPVGRHQPAAWFGKLGQLDFDIDFFDRLLERNPDSIEVLRVLAELVSRKGLYRRAVEIDRRLVERLPDDFLARYKAITSLSTAIKLGYDDMAHMEVDPDLDSLRDSPDFRALLGRE